MLLWTSPCVEASIRRSSALPSLLLSLGATAFGAPHPVSGFIGCGRLPGCDQSAGPDQACCTPSHTSNAELKAAGIILLLRVLVVVSLRAFDFAANKSGTESYGPGNKCCL